MATKKTKMFNIDPSAITDARKKMEPLVGYHILQIMKAEYWEEGKKKMPDGRPVPETLHLFCIVADRRPVNLFLQCWEGMNEEAFLSKMAAFFAAVGTTDIKKLKGRMFRCLLGPRYNADQSFSNNYWAKNFGAVVVEEEDK